MRRSGSPYWLCYRHAEKTDQWDDTSIVVTSDHGEMLGDYGLWGKVTFHDAAFHVPLNIRDPGQPSTQGRTVTMTQSIDVTPVLLTSMGLEVPRSMDGQSLLPFLTDIDTAPPI